MKTVTLSLLGVLAMPSMALAGLSTLDIPSGVHQTNNFTWSSTSGINDWGFQPSASDTFIFHASPDWGTYGVLLMKDNGASGSIDFEAQEGFQISLASFDYSGWNSVSALLDFELLVDGELVYESRLAVSGNSSVQSLQLGEYVGTSLSLQFHNVGTSRVGLDNFAINANAIPAPGAMALLGLAGVVGNRRRRG